MLSGPLPTGIAGGKSRTLNVPCRVTPRFEGHTNKKSNDAPKTFTSKNAWVPKRRSDRPVFDS